MSWTAMPSVCGRQFSMASRRASSSLVMLSNWDNLAVLLQHRGNDLPGLGALVVSTSLPFSAWWFDWRVRLHAQRNVFMIPSDIDHLNLPIIKSQTSPDRRPFARFQRLAERFHCSTTRSPATPCSPCHQPSYLVNSNLPPPGPAHYAARRSLWLTPTKAPERSPSSSSRLRLEQLLSQPGAVHSDEAWKGGVEKVWKGLVGGGTLRRRLPMNLVVCTTCTQQFYPSLTMSYTDQGHPCWMAARPRNMA